jgi:hypothetical protein
MKNLLRTATVTIGMGVSAVVLAAPAGTLLFAQPGSQIIGENGQARPAKRGDVVESGERLLTPPGGISQVLLPDGSLVGVRPGAELKFELPTSASDRAIIVSLLQGSVRVIGSELMDLKKPSALTFLSGNATLKLRGADLETALVKSQDSPTPGSNEAGSYSRLLVGTGSINTGSTVTPLAPRQVSFVGPTNVAPITLSAVSPSLFSSSIALKTTDVTLTSKTPSLVEPTVDTALAPTKLAPSLTTSTLTSPLITAAALPSATVPPPVKEPLAGNLLLQPTITTAKTTTLNVATTIQPPPTVVVQPIYTAPIYIAPVKTITTCSVSISGLKVCR